MARRRQPVVDRGADPTALDRRLAAPLMPGNQKHDAISGVDRLLERSVDRFPRPVEVMAVKVERPVGLEVPCPQPPVPAAV